MIRWFLGLAALVPALASAQALTADETAQIDRAVSTTLARTGVPAASIAVVRGGAVVMARTWGTASAALGPAKPTMPYQIASNSKQFLAALLLRLAREGKLSLDDTLDKWVPEVTEAKAITVRQLLSHTAGLQDYWPQDYAFAAMFEPVTPDAIIRRWATRPLDYRPGTRWQYSNTGFVVAGQVAERAGGAPLATLFARYLFDPLGIHPRFIDDTNGPEFPKGHDRFALGPVHESRPSARGWLYAAGELSMTAEELARWDIARIDRTLLTPAEWTAQETPVRLADGTSSHYGLGLSIREQDGRRVFNHGGESVGFLSQNTVWPDDRAAVVVLTNAGFSDATETLTEAIGKVILPARASAETGEAARLDDIRAEFAALVAGRFVAQHFTADAQGYFTAAARADFRRSLSALGPCHGLAADRAPRLRGGFVNRNFTVTCGKTALTLVTYAEPGVHGRWEQIMVLQD